jgi:hypothetical protein
MPATTRPTAASFSASTSRSVAVASVLLVVRSSAAARSAAWP